MVYAAGIAWKSTGGDNSERKVSSVTLARMQEGLEGLCHQERAGLGEVNRVEDRRLALARGQLEPE